MKRLVFPLILILLLSSCTTKKKLTYLRNVDAEGMENFYKSNLPNYTVQYKDILYVNISSLNSEVSELFNPSSGGNSGSYYMYRDETSLYLNGYVVSDSGNIELPVIGKIKVIGKTITEIKQLVQTEVDKYFSEALVTVRLLTFKISVLGEVNRPGTYKNYNNQLTILEAVSMAGDITDYGDRAKVLVLRPTPDGTKTFRVDLGDASILTSEAFFLMPNDVVIIESIKSKSFKLNMPTISLFLSSVSTLILILNFINVN